MKTKLIIKIYDSQKIWLGHKRQIIIFSFQRLRLQEALWRLHGLPSLPAGVQATTLSLAERVRARPAAVDVGGIASLSVGASFALMNVALTYSAIFFQYNPTSTLKT